MPVSLQGYNPSDPNQARFLSALALSEVGPSGGKYGLYTGTGPTDLTGVPHDQYDFPIWSGYGDSHAAGPFQFQPGTWRTYQQEYNLDFDNPADQNAAAWYHAQKTYAQETGGDLSSALENGDYSSVESALGKTQWIGARGKLASYLSNGDGAPLGGGPNSPSADTSDGRGGMPTGADIVQSIKDLFNPFKSLEGFTRWGLIIVGVIILLVALYFVLADANVVPSPGEVASTAAKVAVLA